MIAPYKVHNPRRELGLLGNLCAALMVGIGLFQTFRHASALIATAPLLANVPGVLTGYLAGFSFILLLWIAVLISGIGIWLKKCWARTTGLLLSATLVVIPLFLAVMIDEMWPDPSTTAMATGMLFIFCYLIDAKEVFEDH